MTRMTPLLERNERFASGYTPIELGVPTAQLLVVTCLDHRVDPAIVLNGRKSIPGRSMGRANQVIPRCRLSSSPVRTSNSQ